MLAKANVWRAFTVLLDSTLLLIGLGQNEKRGRWGGGRQGGKDSIGACLRAVLWSTTNYIDQVKKQTKKTATFTHPEMQTFCSHLHSGITQGSCHLNSINTGGWGLRQKQKPTHLAFTLQTNSTWINSARIPPLLRQLSVSSAAIRIVCDSCWKHEATTGFWLLHK